MRRYRYAFGLLAVLMGCLATTVRAEVRVEGGASAVHVTTSRDAISDVLSALAATFKVRYRSEIPLNAAADPSYAGSLEQVISRLLDGYNYVIKRDRETVEIVVIGRRGALAIPPPAPATPAVNNKGSRLR